MKKIILLAAFLLSIITSAQVPQGISYQAIALNGSGTPVVSSNVRVKLSILDTSATGTVLYAETQLKTTNTQGLFNLVIGQGTVVSGTFNAINWGVNAKFLKVEMDPAGGTSYTTVGTTQLLTVPYAMHAASVASVPAAALNGIGTNGLKSSTFIVLDHNTVKGFYNGTWSSQTFGGEVYESDVISADGNFMILDGSDVKGFAKGIWTNQAFSGEVYESDVLGSNGNFIILDGSSVKGFANGGWTNQAFSGEVYASDVISSNGDFVILDGSSVKGFHNGLWATQAFSGEVYTSDVSSSNGVFLILDGSTIKSYYNGAWSTQTFSGEVYDSQVIGSDRN